MADFASQENRSRMMAGIRRKETIPEMLLWKAKHSRVMQFHLHDRHLPGRPVLLFAMYRAVIFKHGAFWCRHKGFRYATAPATRPDFRKGNFAVNEKREQKPASAYDTYAVLELIGRVCAVAVIPSRSSRKSPRPLDRETYRTCNLFERFFGRIREFRSVATRFDKNARNFLSAVHPAVSRFLLRRIAIQIYF